MKDQVDGEGGGFTGGVGGVQNTSRRWPWAIVVTATAIAALLVWLAGLRFALPPVMPPRPVPDYAVQTVWSLTGVVAVVLIAAATLWIGSRMPQQRSRVVAAGLGATILVGASCGMVALIASAP